MRHCTLFAVALALGLGTAHGNAIASDLPIRVFADVNASAKTDLVQTLAGPDYPLPDVTVELRDGETLDAVVTGPDGWTTAIGPASGVVLMTPRVAGDPPCTTHNTAQRLPAVIDADAPIVYVALGDSTPVVGSDTPYPARLAALLESLGPVQATNLARAGSTTRDWVPGARFFEQSKATVAEADLVTLSLGGNDLQEAAFSDDPFTIIEVAEEAIQNLVLVIEGLQTLNPDMDLVVTVYANYAMSDLWANWVPADYLELVRSGMGMILEQMRDALVARDDVLIGDCYEALLNQDVNPYMFDEIHLNDAGHALYAEVILRSLGGALLPGDDGRERSFAFLADPPATDPDGGVQDVLVPKDAGPGDDAGPEAGIGDAGADGDAATDAATDPDEGGGADSGATDPGQEDTGTEDPGEPAQDNAGGSDETAPRDPGIPDATPRTDGPGPADAPATPDIPTESQARGGGCTVGSGGGSGPGTAAIPLVFLAVLWAAVRLRMREPG
jgi:lysophospholipase L1-like esterase